MWAGVVSWLRARNRLGFDRDAARQLGREAELRRAATERAAVRAHLEALAAEINLTRRMMEARRAGQAEGGGGS